MVNLADTVNMKDVLTLVLTILWCHMPTVQEHSHTWKTQWKDPVILLLFYLYNNNNNNTEYYYNSIHEFNSSWNRKRLNWRLLEMLELVQSGLLRHWMG